MNKLITKNYELTDGVWKLTKTEEETCTVERWNNRIVDKNTLAFFRRLGGKETVQGFKVTSVSPCGTMKTIRELV